MRFLRRCRAALVVLPFVSTAASAADPRAGVVVVGPDSAAVSAAQKTIEARLASVPATVRGADLAAALAGPQAATANAWASDPVARSAFDAALSAAKKSYFSDLMPQATAKLDEAAAIVDRTIDVPGTIRVKVPLWRAAVALRKNQKDTAENEVNVALLLVPNLELEPNSPPPVVQLLADVRAKSPKPFKVQVTGVPATAIVKIDDVVLAPDSIAVLAGPHTIDVIASGFRPFTDSFDAKADTTIGVALVPAIGAAWEKMFDAMAARGDVSEAEKKSLEGLAAREKLDALVVAAVKPGEVGGVVWRRADGSSVSTRSPDAATFAEWAAGQLVPKVVASIPTPAPTAVATATPIAKVTATPAPMATPAATPAPVTAPRHASAFHAAAEAGLGYARWDRTVDPKSGAGYTVPGLSGGGPRVRVHAGREAGIAGQVELSYFTFGTMQVTDRDDEKVNVPGGSLLQVRAGAGWRFAFGDRASLTPSIGGFYESHTAHDLEGENVFPSHTRTGAEVRLTAHAVVGPAGILLEAGVSPFSTWTEDPDGATGQDPATSVDPSFRVGLDLPAGAKGRVALEFAGESRSVQYSGKGTSGLTPVDAKRDELLTVVGLSFRYRF